MDGQSPTPRCLACALALAACACPAADRSPAARASAEPGAAGSPKAAPAAPPAPAGEATPSPAPARDPADPRARQAERARMVDAQIAARGVRSPAVLAAMRAVPRHLFVPDALAAEAYDDNPLPIGHGVTISQPYIVALMSELAAIEPGDRVLEIGAGSGYQAAVLAELGAEVYTVEILEPLAEAARERLQRLGYDRVHVRHGDGYRGWPERAPFDAILLTAAPTVIPAPLKEQLAIGGRLIAPVGDREQSLVVLTRGARGFRQRSEGGVRFVPMTGEAQR